MCQMSAVLDQNGEQQKILDNVTQVEVSPEGVTLIALFEEPKLMEQTKIKKIDFLTGKLTLIAATHKEGER